MPPTLIPPKWRIAVAAIVACAFGTLLGYAVANSDTTVTPQSCITALDASDTALAIVVETLRSVERTMDAIALGNSDGINAETDEVDRLSVQLESVTTIYRSASSDCRNN
jgi:hypothetical protein